MKTIHVGNMLLGVILICGEGAFFAGAVSYAQTVSGSQQITELYQKSIFTVNAYVKPQETGNSQGKDIRILCNVGTALSFGSDEYLVTLDSVVEDADRITVVSSSGEKFDASLLDTSGCISVLKLTGNSSSSLPVIGFDTAASPGSEVQILCLNKYEISAIPGIIDSVRQKDGTLFIKSDGGQATSGAPVFSRDGLVGLLALQIENARVEQPGSPSVKNQPVREQRFVVIPAEYAWMVAQSIINNHDRTCGWLGISSDIIGISKSDGVVIRNVIANSPAEKSGLLINDRIVLFDGKEIGSFRNLIEHLSVTKPGETAQIAIIRGGQKLQIPVLLSPYPQRESSK